jgi:serine/threonine protein kinase
VVPQGPAEVGSTANSYEILAKLATGGMAEIFLARGASVAGVERYVVLKRVLRHRASDAHFVRMFLDEARLAAQLQHPNVAQVYDIGKLGDSYFFTMEYVHGETVRALLQRSHALRRQIPIAAVLTIVAGAAAGLNHAHDRKGIDGRPLNIVHRDVSPSNLMVSYEGNVKLVDFGVAKAAHNTHETASGTVKGKISYLSPEQARGSSVVDRRSDLFALGIVMWELLTLERLYRRDSDFENMVAIVNEPPRAPSLHRPDIPPALDALVLRLLEKTPEQRFQSAEALHEAIEEVAVRTGSALSAASLARYVRELFGERPEPWIEMRSADAHGGAVTVTSEPIPSDLALPVGLDVDKRLGKVPDLSDPNIESSSRHHRPSEALPTTPVPVVDPARDLLQTVRAKPSPLDLPTPVFVRNPSASLPTLHGIAPPVVPVSLIQRSHAPTKKRRFPVAVVILGVAAVLGIAIGIILARGGGDISRQDTSPAAVAESAPPPAQPVAEPGPPPPPPAVDAAPVVEPTIPPDAEPAPATVEPAKPAPAPPHPKARPPVEDVAKLLEAGRYVDVVLACKESASVASQNPVTCVMAACRAHDVVHSKRWLKAASQGKRASLVAACSAMGVSFEPDKTPPPPPPTDKPPQPPSHDCASNPLDCQH